MNHAGFWKGGKITLNDNGMGKHNYTKWNSMQTDYKYESLTSQLGSTKPSGRAGGPG